MTELPLRFGHEFFLTFFPLFGMLVMALAVIACGVSMRRRTMQRRPTEGYKVGMLLGGVGFVVFLILFGYQKVQSERDKEAQNRAFQLSRSAYYIGAQQRHDIQSGKFQVFRNAGRPNQPNGSSTFQTEMMPSDSTQPAR
jgi:multisubunit Na+/H+ antiporter MnhB subunit